MLINAVHTAAPDCAGTVHAHPVRNSPEPWRELLDRQAGVLSRSQLIAIGLSRSQARRHVVNGRWQVLLPGVYAGFTGPVGQTARIWAAVLYAGTDAVASHGIALWLAGVLDRPPAVTHISIPASRRVQPQPGVKVHRTRASADSAHPAALPPRSRIDVALLD